MIFGFPLTSLIFNCLAFFLRFYIYGGAGSFAIFAQKWEAKSLEANYTVEAEANFFGFHCPVGMCSFWKNYPITLVHLNLLSFSCYIIASSMFFLGTFFPQYSCQFNQGLPFSKFDRLSHNFNIIV